MAESNLIYKIIILQLLSLSKGPMTSTQITDFFIEGEYTDYFTIQEALHDLEDTSMIEAESDNNTTRYKIREEGKKTLSLFPDRVTPSMLQDAKDFLRRHELEFKETNALSGTFDKATGGGFQVQLKMRRPGGEQMNLSFQVPTEEMAETICTNWKADYEKVYEMLMDLLVK